MRPWSNRSTVGRELNPDFALLTGEAAEQRVKHPEPRGPTTTPVPVWSFVPSLSVQPRPDYYRLPLLKQPVWIWSVPAYFYVGGIAGGGAVLAAILHGKRSLRRLATACRLLAFVGTTIGPGLLTWDLGRMARFVNMLRVFRPTSPMSIGSWSLAGSGGLATLAILQGDRKGGAPVRWALAGGGLMLSGYTGVLLGNTANPLWQGARRTLPVLFTASSMASTAGALEFVPMSRKEEKVIDSFGAIGKVAEVVSMEAMEREAGRNPVAAEAFQYGRSGLLWKSAKVLVAAGAIMSLIPIRSRWKRRMGGALTTVGAICLRYALLEAGREAARDPQAVIIDQQPFNELSKRS